MNVMQDLGFIIEKTEQNLGLITGSKDRDAREIGQEVGAIAVSLLLGVSTKFINTDKNQKIRASVVVSKNSSSKYIVRVSFQRAVWGHNGDITKAETIKDEDIYKIFFEKLDKATFLEGVRI